MKPELSRPLRLDTLGSAPRSIRVEGGIDELAALARRFALQSIDRLEADLECSRNGDAVEVSGRLQARVVQSCVASGAPVPATVDEYFRLRFLPQAVLDGEGGDEIELSEEDCDVIGYDGAAVDLGEAVAETLALSLDPFPRASDADAALKAAGVLSEEDAGPFSALRSLKDKLSGKS